MPRLPNVRDVNRVSTDGLRLPALNVPAPDPTGAALEGFGQSLGSFGKALGEFDQKQKMLQAAEDKARLRRLDSELMRDRAHLVANPPEDQSDDTGPDDTSPVRRGLRVFDQIARDKLEGFGEGPLRKRAEDFVQANRMPFETRLKLDDHNARIAAIATGLDETLLGVREAAAAQPELMEFSRGKGLDTLRETAKALGWSDETLLQRELAFEQDLWVDVLRSDIARGAVPMALELLQDSGIRKTVGEDNATALTQEAEARRGSEVTAILSGLDIDTAQIEQTGIVDAAQAKRAAELLTPEQFDDFELAQTRAQTLHAFGRQHGASSNPEIEAAAAALRPAEGTSEADQKTFEAVTDKAQRMIAERNADPGADAEGDPQVAAAKESGDAERAVTLSLAVQKKRGVPEELRKVLPQAEARQLAADLDAVPALARAPEILKLKEKYGTHFGAVLAQMQKEGLDSETAAIAAIADNPKKLQALLPAVGVSYVQLTEGKTPDQIADLQSALETQREAQIQAGRLDPSVEPFVIQKAALRAFDQSGNPQLAVKQAVEIFAEPSAASTNGETLTGSPGRDELLLAQGRPEEAKTPGEVNSFFDERWEQDDEAFAAEAAKFGLNPDRALLLRDILKAGQNGITAEEKAALLERTKGRPFVFRQLINTLEIGKKVEDARKKAGIIFFKDLADKDRARSKAEIGLEFLESLPGGKRKPSKKPGATQGGGSERAKFFTLPNSDVPFPTKIGKKNFKEDYEKWFELIGKSLAEKRARSNLKEIKPAESFIWRNLITAKSIGNTRKTNSLKGKRLRQFEWDFTHSEIEVYDRGGKHIGAMDPLTGKMIKPADPKKKIKSSEIEQTSPTRPV